jgi:hypothetical protein
MRLEEGLTAAKMSGLVFWVVNPCGPVNRYHRFEETYRPEDGDSMFLRNVGIYTYGSTCVTTQETSIYNHSNKYDQTDTESQLSQPTHKPSSRMSDAVT